MPNGLVVRTDGTVEDFNEKFELEAIYTATRTQCFDVLAAGESIFAYVDDEGLLNNSLPNFKATFVLTALGYPAHFLPAGAIMGDILFFGGVDEEGYDLGLNDEQENILRDLLDAAG